MDIFAVVPDMKLSPNVGSDRSWVWNAAADVSEGEPEAQTLAIRFANSESKFHYCGPFQMATCADQVLQTPTFSRRPSSRRSRRTRHSSPRSKLLEDKVHISQNAHNAPLVTPPYPPPPTYSTSCTTMPFFMTT